MTYTVDYFIEKFTAIPDEKWCCGHLLTEDGRSCALGHCGVRIETELIERDSEAGVLYDLFARVLKETAVAVNDGYVTIFGEPTPKARILAALNYINQMSLCRQNQ